ncbi:MAG: hypothetical protein CVV25_06005 [Ignavibacteriae bacterium HGW-Ignavibacteriae-4]|jgi:hypothetical protein|nr:MAG: hypothetical protein CVV25_06005 [Ignavibacteriae bacterium HGW-Ignavibacteriae-4]
MDFLKDKFKLIFITSFLILVGCSNPNIKRIESISGIKLEEYLTKIEVIEQWNDFNGNGNKIIIYKIEKEKVNFITNSLTLKGFNTFNMNNDSTDLFSNSELAPFLKNSEGVYKDNWFQNEFTTIIIDTVNKKLIYFFTIM